MTGGQRRVLEGMIVEVERDECSHSLARPGLYRVWICLVEPKQRQRWPEHGGYCKDAHVRASQICGRAEFCFSTSTVVSSGLLSPNSSLCFYFLSSHS